MKPLSNTPLAAATAAIAAALALLLALPASAQSDPKAEVRAAVNRTLTPLIGDNSREIVSRVLQVRPEGAISRNFNLQRILPVAFGRAGAVSAPDCKGNVTAQGEPEESSCTLEQGRREDPTSAYAALHYSKNIGRGHLKYLKRAAFRPGDDGTPRPVRLSDAEAHSKALDFALLLGVPESEIPRAPAGARNPVSVRSLVVAAEQDRGGGTRIPIQKVVTIPRAFAVPGGLWRDPATGILLSHVVAPGNAVVALDDTGVQFARIDGWSDAQLDPKLNPALAKSLGTLVNEITDDLYNEGVRKVGTMSILISLRRAYPHPDDPNPPLCPVCGLLRPALKVVVSQLGAERAQTSERAYAAPGLIREYDLVEVDTDRPAR